MPFPRKGSRKGTHTSADFPAQVENILKTAGRGPSPAIRFGVCLVRVETSELAQDATDSDGRRVLIEQQRRIVVYQIENELERGSRTRGSQG